MYRRLFAMILCAIMLFGLTACGGTETPQKRDDLIAADTLPSDLPEVDAVEPAKEETKEIEQESNENYEETENTIPEPEEQPSNPSAPVQAENPSPVPQEPLPVQPSQTTPVTSEQLEDESKVLIAYFTWAENTVVANPTAVDVDATTSASVLAPGHVAQMASWIQAETGGDLFSIVTTEPYSSNYDECLDRAADEKADNARPSLTGSVRNMADYDVVFLGYPDWWATCPMAVFTFLESCDFTGKTVIPFCAHGTSGLASSVRDIKAALPGVTVLDAVGVQRPGMDTPLETARSTVTGWLAGLEY